MEGKDHSPKKEKNKGERNNTEKATKRNFQKTEKKYTENEKYCTGRSKNNETMERSFNSAGKNSKRNIVRTILSHTSRKVETKEDSKFGLATIF